jgi:putative FmdB family regulatory protein
MPTYDYVCAACEHHLEVFQSMLAKELKKCPACGKRKLQRLIGAGAGVIFKGSGFYQTDYKNPGRTDKTDKTDKSDRPDTPSEPEAPAGGCSSACGTDAAPKGCRMAKKARGKD